MIDIQLSRIGLRFYAHPVSSIKIDVYSGEDSTQEVETQDTEAAAEVENSLPTATADEGALTSNTKLITIEVTQILTAEEEEEVDTKQPEPEVEEEQEAEEEVEEEEEEEEEEEGQD